MKLRNTLLLLIVAAGLFAYIQFVEKGKPDAKTAKEKGEQLTQIDRDKITAVSIKNAEAKIELKKNESGAWLLEEPLKDRANSFAVTQLFSAVELLKNSQVIDPRDKKADPNIVKDSGVETSNVRVKFMGEKTTELILGNDSAIEGKIYARVEGDPKIYVIGNDLKTQITKKPEEFRDKKLMDLTTTAVTRVQLKTAAGEIEAEKKNEHWTLVKPLAGRADDAKVNDIIANATNAQIETFVTDSTNLTTFGLAEPKATLMLRSEGAKEPTVLQIGGSPTEEKDKGKFYAKLSTRDSVVVLPKSIETILNTKPNDLRDRNLVRVESDLVDRITIEPAGKEKIVLARAGEKWVRKAGDKDVEINGALATTMLDALRNQQVTNFVADVASELPKYGLDAPTLKVTLSSFASENTAETQKGEKPIAAVLFGKVEGDQVNAKVESEPFVVAVPKSVLEQIVTDPVALQPLEIFKHKPEDITSLEITSEGQPVLSLEKDKDKGWKLAKGDGVVNQPKAIALVNMLATLRATRWVGAEDPKQGFEKPAVTIACKGAANGKLVLGASHPENLWHAKADGVNGVFLIGVPEAEVFRATLIDKPGDAAKPPTAGAPPAPGAPGTPITVTTPPVSVTTPPVTVPPAKPEPPKAEPAPLPEKPQPSEAPKPAPAPEAEKK